MNQAVTDFIDNLKLEWQVEICKAIRQTIHQSIPSVEERIQYGKPHYLKNGKYACVLGTAKGWVSFTIFNAESLQAPDGFFEASDVSERKTVKIREGQTVDYELLGKLIQQASNTI